MSQASPCTTSPPVTPTLRERVASLVEKHGVSGAAKLLGVGREPLARVAAGLAVRRGTLALIEQGAPDR